MKEPLDEYYYLKPIDPKNKPMKPKVYYMLVNKKGNPITIDAQLPIYWFKIVAAREAMKYKCYVSRVTLNKVDVE